MNKTIGIIAVVLILVGLGAAVIFLANGENGEASQSPIPTSTSNPNNNQTITPSPTEQSFQSVTLPLVSLGAEVNDDETFGCADSIVMVSQQGDFSAETSVEAALNELFATEQTTTSEDGGELYNSLANSDLEVDEVVEENGNVTVYLTGQLMIGGTCDNPRVEEQLTRTVEENTTANEIEIFINDETLSEALSLQ